MILWVNEYAEFVDGKVFVHNTKTGARDIRFDGSNDYDRFPIHLVEAEVPECNRQQQAEMPMAA